MLNWRTSDMLLQQHPTMMCLVEFWFRIKTMKELKSVNAPLINLLFMIYTNITQFQ